MKPSVGVGGWTATHRKDAKVFHNGPYLIGYTSSFRMGQILRWSFTPPEPPEGDLLDRFMCTTWIDAVRKGLRDGGWAKKDAEREEGGIFLVGVGGRLFVVEADYQVGEHVDGYAAVGSGDQLAMGALAATAGLDLEPEKRVLAALEAAERHNIGVRGPFHLLWEPEAARRGTIRMEDT